MSEKVSVLLEKIAKFEAIFEKNKDLHGNRTQFTFAEKQVNKFRNRLINMGEINLEDQIEWLKSRKETFEYLRYWSFWNYGRYIYYERTLERIEKDFSQRI